ncbi:hypothetical protein C0993_000206 [Termitomyces sp. T159_Od127]|nr:hypothetical protein C0993_000206 [Termitomyces sp. T159_Od127]
METENDNNGDDDESIWLSLLLSPAVLATVWHFFRLFARRLIRSPALHPVSVEKQSVHPMPWSQPSPVIVRRKKVECRDRVTQPRVFISTLPSLPAGSDTLIIIPQESIEFNASATVSVPILTSVSQTEKTEMSSTPPDRTETTVTALSLGIVLPTTDQAGNTISLCTPSPMTSSSAELPSKESALQQNLSRPPTPTLSPSVSEQGQCSEHESAPVANMDAMESSPSLPACEDMVDASAASLPLPLPTPATEKRVPTQESNLPILKTELPAIETATADLSHLEMQEPCLGSSPLTVEALLDLVSDSIYVPEAAEPTPEDVAAPTTQTDLSNAEVEDLCVLESTERAIETTTPASLSDSIWALKPSEIISKDVASITTPPPSEEAASGLQDSVWAVVPDVSASSRLTCENASEDLDASVTMPPPTAVELSSSLSESIWASEPIGATSENVAAPVPLVAEKASGLQSSIWATADDVTEIVAPPATSYTSPSRPTTPDVPKVTPPMTLLTPPPSAKKVSASLVVEKESGVQSSILATVADVPEVDALPVSGIKASIWADDNSTALTSSTSVPICEDLNPTTAVETNSESSSSLSDSIWANEVIEATAENVVAPAPQVVEKESGVQSSIWATVADVNEVVELPVTSFTPPPRPTTPDAPKVVTLPMTLLTPPPSAKKVSGISASIWADDNSTALTSSTSAPIYEEGLLPTTAIEARSESSSSLSSSIWAHEAIETTAENVVVPTPLVAEKASGVRSSIWATVDDVTEVAALPVTLSTPPPKPTTPDVPEVVTPSMSLPTPARRSKVSGTKASVWADDTSTAATSSTPASMRQKDLFACKKRNLSVSASRWANVPGTPSTRVSTGKVNADCRFV